MSTEALALAQPSVDMNWPWSDLLTDVVLTSVGGLGVKGRGEGVVWVGSLYGQVTRSSEKRPTTAAKRAERLLGDLGGAQESWNS